jgi:hypothetical protein
MSDKLRIRQGEDFANVSVPEKVSENVMRYDLWEFKQRGYKSPYELGGLSRSGMLEFLTRNGYYRLAPKSVVVVRVQQGVVDIVGTESIKAHIIGHLESIDSDGHNFKYGKRSVSSSKLALTDTYLKQHHLVINEGNLEHLKPLPFEILSDDAKTAFFPFQDGIVKVTATGFSVIGYGDLDGKCVWKEHISNRKHPILSNESTVASKFEDFLGNITGGDVSRLDSFRSAIGYLLHNYTRPGVARAIVLYDEEVSDGSTANGGTGKGIIAEALGRMRKVTCIDGKIYRSDDRFKFQLVNEDTQNIWLDDPRSDFVFEDLFSAISKGLSVEGKNQSKWVFAPQRSPKFIITSNTILRGNGNSSSRRQYVLELGPYYKNLMAQGFAEPVAHEHGGDFFDDESWDEAEWARFDLFMLRCTQFYLAEGLAKSEPVNVALNKLIQQTSEEFVQWAMEKGFQLATKYDTKQLFDEFKGIHFGDDPQFKQRGFTTLLKHWALFKGWKLEVKRSNGSSKFHFQSL